VDVFLIVTKETTFSVMHAWKIRQLLVKTNKLKRGVEEKEVKEQTQLIPREHQTIHHGISLWNNPKFNFGKTKLQERDQTTLFQAIA
jgi:hypothetical protein